MAVDNIKTIKSQLLTYENDLGGYITYVFKNLDSINNYDRYVMCTRFPNWETPNVNIGEIGFLKYKEIEGGKDKYYDNHENLFKSYKFNGIHFIDFVAIKQNNKDIIL